MNTSSTGNKLFILIEKKDNLSDYENNMTVLFCFELWNEKRIKNSRSIENKKNRALLLSLMFNCHTDHIEILSLIYVVCVLKSQYIEQQFFLFNDMKRLVFSIYYDL